jgi:uncharacterized damage-inducible protein DinB
MEPTIAVLSDMLRLNTKLFRNCLEGMSDEQARVRPSGRTNNAAFVAAHLADSRYYTLRALGAERPNPLASYLEGVRGIEGMTRWPGLDEIQSAWTDASRALRARLEALTAADLDGPSAARFPAPWSMREALVFMVQHDSYHVGQLSLLRSHAGLPAMRYE